MQRGSPAACSACFNDHGIRMMVSREGWQDDSMCPNCESHDGIKLGHKQLMALAYHYFVAGTLLKPDFGSAPVIQFNQMYEGEDLVGLEYLKDDLSIFERVLGVKFFNYGPRLWMVGENYPLQSLVDDDASPQLQRILDFYPERILSPRDRFYRLRVNPEEAYSDEQYDSPPEEYCGSGRYDSRDLAVLYASPDLQTCLHEVRVTVADEVYAALLAPSRNLKLLDLSTIIDDGQNDFESLDIAMYMLAFAGDVAKPACRRIAKYLAGHGYDGIVFSSYFSAIRTGSVPFEISFGISNRLLPNQGENEAAKIMPNLAFFGRPIADGRIKVVNKNRVTVRKVEYTTEFGPVIQKSLEEANERILEEIKNLG